MKFYIAAQNKIRGVKNVEPVVEIRKADSRGRLTLPADWRQAELSESNELLIVKRKSSLKLVPKRRIDLTEWFDKIDLGDDLDKYL